MSSQPPRKTVDFDSEPSIQYIDKPYRPDMTKQLFETFDGHQITESMLKEAAGLFNDNYGIWGIDPTSNGPFPKPGELHQNPFYMCC